MATCLTKIAMAEVNRRWKDYVENGAPVMADLDLADPVARELEARMLIVSSLDPFDKEDAIEYGENPPADAVDLHDRVEELREAAKEAAKTGVWPQELTAKGLQMFQNFFTFSSAKLVKGKEYGFLTAGLSLMPSTIAGLGDLCSHASEGCRHACLVASGRADMKAQGVEGIWDFLRNNAGSMATATQNKRYLRTLFYTLNPNGFMEHLDRMLDLAKDKAKRDDMTLCMRLNVTSDIAWETKGVYQKHTDIVGYDYTKIASRVIKFLESPAFERFTEGKVKRRVPLNPNSQWPVNYYLSFSASEVNFPWLVVLSNMGANIVVPFDLSLGYAGARKNSNIILPDSFIGHRVIDGDQFDMRFVDYIYWQGHGVSEPPPYVVGLRVKGVSQTNEMKKGKENDFFYNAKEAQEISSDKEWIADRLHISINRLFNQLVPRGMNPMSQLPTTKMFRDYAPELGSTYERILNDMMQSFAKK